MRRRIYKRKNFRNNFVDFSARMKYVPAHFTRDGGSHEPCGVIASSPAQPSLIRFQRSMTCAYRVSRRDVYPGKAKTVSRGVIKIDWERARLLSNLAPFSQF